MSTCPTCRFRSRNLCRRNPPLVAPGAAALWPRVEPSDWCGEWQEALEAPKHRPAKARSGEA